MPRVLTIALAAAVLLAASHLRAQEVDPAIAANLAAIRAIDNHAHPVLSPPEDATDRNFDALPVDNMEPETDPLSWRPDFPPLAAAWKSLFGFTGQPPLSPEALQQLDAARARAKQKHGTGYSAWVLDQAGEGTMLANRVSMGVGVQPPRFRWVPYVDALLFPFSNSGLGATNPDRTQFFLLEDKLRSQYLQAVGLATPPATLDAYLAQVVIPTLERQHAGGAVAEKFEVAYLRSFDFSNPSHDQAAEIYARLLHQPTPDPAAYKLLQDFLFHQIARECGRLGMAVHLHGMSGGGGYFSIAGVNPLLLEPIFNDPTLRRTNFVLLHGGWPFVHEAGALLQKPNVYLDLSQQSLTIPPRTLALWLREWLELFPEKVLFGTDGYPYTASLGWEEATWIASRQAREALGIALTGMLHDHEITPARANTLAEMVLRTNAQTLYKLPQ